MIRLALLIGILAGATFCRPSASPAQDMDFPAARAALVRELEGQGIEDPEVLAAIGRVPRERFISRDLHDEAYDNHPLPIGGGQTISQPFIVARMTEMLDLQPGERVLEVGTGSGYQAAVLAELATVVFSVEILPELAETAGALLRELGYTNVHVRAGDGYQGWPEHAPFDAIIVTAAPNHIPQPLIDQLAVGGRLVIPVGDDIQQLTLVERTESGVTTTRDLPVRFVPMTGEAEERSE